VRTHRFPPSERHLSGCAVGIPVEVAYSRARPRRVRERGGRRQAEEERRCGSIEKVEKRRGGENGAEGAHIANPGDTATIGVTVRALMHFVTRRPLVMARQSFGERRITV